MPTFVGDNVRSPRLLSCLILSLAMALGKPEALQIIAGD